MLQQISKIKIFIWELLEKELIAVLAICFVSLSMWLVNAASDTTDMSFVILDAGTLTVADPNGGENWQVDSSQHIIWTSTGSVSNVKIELQRTVAGAWETLTASTTNDGDYPWLVTEPATTTATVRISSVTVPAITDSSDAVFTVSAVPAGSSSPGGYLPTYPMIDSVSPMSFYYGSATELVIRGLGFENQAWVTLNQIVFPVEKPHTRDLMTLNLLPNTLAVGTYRLCAYNALIQSDCYSHLITVTDKTQITPPTTGGVNEEYIADLVNQSPALTLKYKETAVLWVEFKNTGTATWYQDGENPVRLGTDAKRDRRSSFYHSSWLKYNRPVLVNRVVKPGEIGRFEFTIQAPWTAKIYTEAFRPVAEWKTWMKGNNQVEWTLTVKKQSFWQKIFSKPTTPVVIKPTVPSTGGKVELPFQPKEALLFTDNIERIYQKVTQTLTSIFSKLRQ
ncbi:MAG: hypothetical protein WC805_02180 [Patescibacteria group bacterium]|jgi:hypothetical protein